MSAPEDLRYTKEHEWLKEISKDQYRVGITDYAQVELGDIVFVDLPAIGLSCEAGKSFATVESVKAVSEIYSPLNGTVVEVNEQLSNSPEKINQDAFGEGWIAVIESSSVPDTLMDAAQYTEYLSELCK